jgi:hypothetical protein
MSPARAPVTHTSPPTGGEGGERGFVAADESSSVPLGQAAADGWRGRHEGDASWTGETGQAGVDRRDLMIAGVLVGTGALDGAHCELLPAGTLPSLRAFSHRIRSLQSSCAG